MANELFDSTGRPIIVLDNPDGAGLFDENGRPYKVVAGGIVSGGGVTAGASFPAGPTAGQMFLHTPTGRKWLYQYDGTNWHTVRSYGQTDIYVDPSGTDDLAHGTATGANAFATIAYAWQMLPPNLEIPVRIFLGAGTYSESISLDGKTAIKGSNYSSGGLGDDANFINVYGTMTIVASNIATGGYAGSGANPAYILGSFTANAHDNLLVKFTSGANNGYHRVIGQTTTTALYLLDSTLPAAPQNGDTYQILDWESVIQTSTAYGIGCNSQRMLWLHQLKVTGIGSSDIMIGLWDHVFWNVSNCCFSQTAGNVLFWISNQSLVVFWDSVFLVNTRGIHVDNNSGIEADGIRVVMKGATGLGIELTYGGQIAAIRGSEIVGGSSKDYAGIDCNNSHGVTNGGSVNTFIHHWGYGIKAYNHGSFFPGGKVTAGKLLDGTNDANTNTDYKETTSYSYVGS